MSCKTSTDGVKRRWTCWQLQRVSRSRWPRPRTLRCGTLRASCRAISFRAPYGDKPIRQNPLIYRFN